MSEACFPASSDAMQPGPMWAPSASYATATRMAAFAELAGGITGRALSCYADLHHWSVSDPERFWAAIWTFCGVIGTRGERVLENGDRMPGARWFPEARLNFAQNLLCGSNNEVALVFRGEDKLARSVSRSALYQQVARFAAALKAAGVVQGDRVAAYMPNMPETVVAMLATASLGAIFTSASPDFGVQGVLDRFGQTAPKVLVACDGYWYNGKAVDVCGKLAQIGARLPGLQQLVLVPYLNESVDALADGLPHGVSLEAFLAPFSDADEIEFLALPFDHPLYIVYSSGTTGVPKCIVHSAGGTLLQHLKEHQLHADIRESDRLFYYTTCGWMMWNWLVSGLASGATLLLYDGSPFAAEGRILWDYAEDERMTHFGTSAKYIDSLAASEIRPGESYDLRALRVMLSTGSPLLPEAFDFIYRHVSPDLQVSSIAGGTDILSCFVLGAPTLPVWRGEIQCKGLGMAVEVWDDDGRPLTRGKGELVCVKPFPSMPLGFWQDERGARYRAAYFERFPGVWCHGDFCEITANEGLVIHGRSDTTLNPGGVRIGTAEIYRQVERLDEVVESLVIGQDWPPHKPSDVRVVLFVKLRQGLVLDEELVRRIKQGIRDNTTPRHVPAKVVQVAELPRTHSGKLVELAVRSVVHGLPVRNLESLANPEALKLFANLEELAG